jgi:hypothetical protein
MTWETALVIDAIKHSKARTAGRVDPRSNVAVPRGLHWQDNGIAL